MSRFHNPPYNGTHPAEEPQPRASGSFALPPDLEELDRRLEASVLFPSDIDTDELCLWACACFLVHGS